MLESDREGYFFSAKEWTENRYIWGMKILIITGPPYSGKGTQCEIISKAIGFTHVSTGDLLRQEKENKTPIGLVMADLEKRGELLSDSIMKDLFSRIIDENKESKGILLDGYPRTNPQVDDLIELVASKHMAINMVINIEVPREELLARAAKRAAQSNRVDDKDAALHTKRIEIFEQSTKPAIDYMRTLLPVEDIDGIGSIEEITEKLMQKVKAI